MRWWLSSWRLVARVLGAAALVAALALAATASTPTAHGATFTVNTTNDVDDGTCNVTHCSLREAINAANSAGGPDVIAFNIGGGGIQTISVALSFPAITSPTTIDGTTQPGYAGTPLIELKAGVLFQTAFSASNSLTLKGLSITGYNFALILESGANSSSITANWFGVNPQGVSSPNNRGLYIQSDNNAIGGATAALRNVIVSKFEGIKLQAADANVIHGNYIGVMPDGLTTAGGDGGTSYGVGLFQSSTNNRIGGTTASARNVIGNFNTGIMFDGTATGTIVEGNYVGLAADGQTLAANTFGIQVAVSGGGTAIIGGPTAASRNVISGNSSVGIRAYFDAPEIRNNYIGVGPDGSTPMGNGTGGATDANIRIDAGSPVVASNTIAYSAGDGIIVTGAAADAEISQNSIFLNDGLGIDLNNDGVTANDPGDSDTGPNSLQNFPTITSATTTSSGTTVMLNLQTGGPIGAAVFTVYVSNPCDPTGFGEGGQFVGAALALLTSASTNVPVTLTTPVSPGMRLTAQVSYVGSSEFGPCFTVPACGSPSTDCDGFNDIASAKQVGPSNTDVTVDNCANLWNQSQLNSDGNFVDNSPPYAPAVDDKTWPRSGPMGDDCDLDDDNDGLGDGVEGGLPYAPCPTASGPTNPLLRDTDGDRFLDGAECTLGFDPTSAGSAPTLAQCGVNADPDLDKISTRVEFCYYNSNPNSNDTDGDAVGGLDGDGGKDGCEIASFNGDQEVNSGDQGMLGAGIVGTQPYTSNVDVNKDGVLNSGDQGLQASFIVPPGQCP